MSQVIKTEWVVCPICGTPDNRRETDDLGNAIIHCTNHACRSNGGDYQIVPTPTREVWLVLWEEQEGPTGRRGVQGVFESEAHARACAEAWNRVAGTKRVWHAEQWVVKKSAENINIPIDNPRSAA